MKKEKEINKELIEKVLSGEATSEEKKTLFETKAMKACMRRQWDKNDDKPIDAEIGRRMWKQIDRRCHAREKKIWQRLTFMRYAACAFILLLIGSLWFILDNQIGAATEFENVFARTHQQLTLPDRSKIWMQPGSSLRYAKDFTQNREVWLTGDAVFEVTRNNGQLFRVHIDQAFIEVKGTAFRVESRQQNPSEVTLFNGRVDFHPANGQIVAMKPQQRLTYYQDGKTRLENTESINWEDGVYKFKDIPLDTLINTVKKIYGIDIRLSSEVSTYHRFTGIIRYDERPSEFIEKICYNMNLKYRREHNNYIIYKPL